MGEHGDSEVLLWSQVTVAGMPLSVFLERRELSLDAGDRAAIDEGVRRAAYRIIEGKGATYYGIGSALARIVEVIVRNQAAILTVTACEGGLAGMETVPIALPRLVGEQGVLDTFLPTMSEDEEQALKSSAEIVAGAVQSLMAT